MKRTFDSRVKTFLGGAGRKSHSLKPHVARSSCVPLPSEITAAREKEPPLHPTLTKTLDEE